PWAPKVRVFPRPAAPHQSDDARRQRGRVDHVGAAEGVDSQLVIGPLGATHRYGGMQANDGVTRARARDLNRIRAIGAVDDDGVGRAIADATARRAGQVEVNLGDAGAREVIHGDRVGPAFGVEVDALDAVEVHGHGGHIAGEAHPRAVGRDVDLLGDVGAVEEHAVEAGLALDGVVAVAGVPDEYVVAGAEGGDVVAAPTDDEVVA